MNSWKSSSLPLCGVAVMRSRLAVSGWSRTKKLVLLLLLVTLPLYLGLIMTAIGSVVPCRYSLASR